MVKQVISFHYRLTDKKGQEIDSSVGADPLMFLEGGGQIIPGLEKFLITLQAGDKKEITVPYQEAYGAYDQILISQVPRDRFPAQEIKIGDMFQVGKESHQQIVMVIDISDSLVTIDANHPLAGQDLTFAVEIVSRRDAMTEEILHGHAHGPHGHGHH